MLRVKIAVESVATKTIGAQPLMPPEGNVPRFLDRMTMFPLFMMFIGFGKSCVRAKVTFESPTGVLQL